MSAPLATIEVAVSGPVATHSAPCAVCRERPAVLDLYCGVMRPCWGCRDMGWRTHRPGRLVRWLIDRGER